MFAVRLRNRDPGIIKIVSTQSDDAQATLCDKDNFDIAVHPKEQIKYMFATQRGIALRKVMLILGYAQPLRKTMTGRQACDRMISATTKTYVKQHGAWRGRNPHMARFYFMRDVLLQHNKGIGAS